MCMISCCAIALSVFNMVLEPDRLGLSSESGLDNGLVIQIQGECEIFPRFEDLVDTNRSDIVVNIGPQSSCIHPWLKPPTVVKL
jgi:hypothetical protein